jgi:hypothetical protein
MEWCLNSMSCRGQQPLITPNFDIPPVSHSLYHSFFEQAFSIPNTPPYIRGSFAQRSIEKRSIGVILLFQNCKTSESRFWRRRHPCFASNVVLKHSKSRNPSPLPYLPFPSFPNSSIVELISLHRVLEILKTLSVNGNRLYYHF